MRGEPNTITSMPIDPPGGTQMQTNPPRGCGTCTRFPATAGPGKVTTKLEPGMGNSGLPVAILFLTCATGVDCCCMASWDKSLTLLDAKELPSCAINKSRKRAFEQYDDARFPCVSPCDRSAPAAIKLFTSSTEPLLAARCNG